MRARRARRARPASMAPRASPSRRASSATIAAPYPPDRRARRPGRRTARRAGAAAIRRGARYAVQRLPPAAQLVGRVNGQRPLHPRAAHQPTAPEPSSNARRRRDQCAQSRLEQAQNRLQPQDQAGVDDVLTGGAAMDMARRTAAPTSRAAILTSVGATTPSRARPRRGQRYRARIPHRPRRCAPPPPPE